MSKKDELRQRRGTLASSSPRRAAIDPDAIDPDAIDDDHLGAAPPTPRKTPPQTSAQGAPSGAATDNDSASRLPPPQVKPTGQEQAKGPTKTSSAPPVDKSADKKTHHEAPPDNTPPTNRQTDHPHQDNPPPAIDQIPQPGDAGPRTEQVPLGAETSGVVTPADSLEMRMGGASMGWGRRAVLNAYRSGKSRRKSNDWVQAPVSLTKDVKSMLRERHTQDARVFKVKIPEAYYVNAAYKTRPPTLEEIVQLIDLYEQTLDLGSSPVKGTYGRLEPEVAENMSTLETDLKEAYGFGLYGRAQSALVWRLLRNLAAEDSGVVNLDL